jgi:hypothetical protein
MELLLGSNLTGRQVYQLVVPVLIVTGLEGTCSGLTDFLTVALVTPSATAAAPLTVHHQVSGWLCTWASHHQLASHSSPVPGRDGIATCLLRPNQNQSILAGHVTRGSIHGGGGSCGTE